MSTNVRVIHHSDFLRLRADGRADIERAKTVLAQAAVTADALDKYEILIDIRDTVGRLTADEVCELAASLDQFRGTFLHKTAVLCPRERFENSKVFSLLAGSHGFHQIRAFLNYEDAMEWLLAPSD